MISGTAIILTNGWLDDLNAKTAHGLLRGTERFQILGVVDPVFAGQDAGQAIFGKSLNIPVFQDVEEAVMQLSQKPEYCIVGVATHGGKLPDSLRAAIRAAIENGITIISGLHSYLADDMELKRLADKFHVHLIDIRKPRPVNELRFWTGEIYQVKTPRIALLGMDCVIGKRTTGRMLLESCRKAGIKAELIYTGQTGWLQGLKYGFIFDSTMNDFIAGEIERVVLECDHQEHPEVIFIEGQSSLRNPSGPCGSELILSGDCKGVILQHAPGREFFDGYESRYCRIPSIEEEIELIRLYGARTLGITLNEQNMNGKALKKYGNELEEHLRIPVVRPLTDGMLRLVAAVKTYISEPAFSE